ncbi:MAG: non-ribosomal peptide synthase/polyketide synthase, partial [Halanaerobiales bacterium]|nr:non-ribosomal peptide synthase/polyketide synthase [Halanaerobiales bacterium]
MSIKQKKINNQNVQDILSLTPMQEGMLFHYLKNSEEKFYLEQLSLSISGKIDLELIEKAWNYVIEANEMLRTVFRWEKLEKPIQITLKNYKVPIRIKKLSNLDNTEKKISEIKESDKSEKIDISTEPFKVTLIKFSDNECMMIITYHHILYDGWSNGIILKEFIQTYNALFENIVLVKPQKNKFKEFVKWLQDQDKDEQENYWIQYLEGFDSKTVLPVFQETQQRNVGPESYKFTLEEKLTKSINSFTKENKITFASLFYGIWGLLLQRYNNTEDVVFGTTVSGRNADIKGLEEMVGLFINTIPLRVRKSENSEESIIALLKNIDNVLKERTKYENVPLVDIQSYSGIDSKEGLFDSIVVIENYPLDKQLNEKDNKLKIESYSISESTNFDFTLTVEMNDCINIQFIYNTLRFDEQLIMRISEHFCNILSYILEKPDEKLSEIDMLTEEEKNKVLYEFNDTMTNYPKEKTLHKLFEEQVERTPDNTAVVSRTRAGELTLTYRELNEKANRLARTLREKGVKSDSIVGILVDRSLEMMVGIFGILKAGGAYLPITPEYPMDRIKYILDDSQTNIVLTQSKHVEKVMFNREVIILEDNKIYSSNGENLRYINTANDLAYVIYTSGSTGKPKGVIVEHQSVVNILTNMQNDYPLMEDGTYLLKTTFTFDVSVTELFGWFMGNGRIAILPPEGEKDLTTIVEAINKYNVTHINFVPSMLNVFLDGITEQDIEKITSLRYMFVAGEAFPRELARRCNAKLKDVTVENIYGPTETTIYVIRYSTASLKDERIVPIGKPLNNVTAYIVNNYNKLLPIGVAGELCISGDCLTRGYFNRSDLTVEKFVDSPFNSEEKMYKTGDLVRWLPDGNIEFLGRIDHQVKIRGFRIELGEIESQLLNYTSIKEAIVVDREDKHGAKYLYAYVVSEKEIKVGELTPKELREFLLKSLPEYMIPSYFVQLDEMPLNANGKIDRKAIPEPEGNIMVGTEYEASRNETEEKLVEMWKEILGIEKAGINDNFFELGGHSLKATILAAKMHKELDVEVSLSEIFKRPTIKGISEYIQNIIRARAQTAYEKIENVESADYYEASSAQKRMYMLQQFDLSSTSYNMPGVFEVEGMLNVERVEQAFDELLRRHETLRTSFETIDEKIVQRINSYTSVDLEYIEKADIIIEEAVNKFIRPFGLTKAPLFRVGVIRLEEDKYILIFDIHHIISDGISLEILINEFASLYEGKELDSLRIQYKDYAKWQNKLLRSDVMEKQEKYWVNRFNDEVPVLNMTTDYPRSTIQNFEGDRISFKIDKEIIKNLDRLSKETGSTMYMVLLSGVNILLSKYSGQEDIIVGSPIAGRPHADLEKIIGMFVNTIAMRNNPDGNKTYKEFLKQVKENALEAYNHQDYQFEELVEQLDLSRDMSRNPLFDVMFTMQNMQSQNFNNNELVIENLELKLYNFDHRTSKFDLTISATETDDELILNFEYSTKLYKRETIERMIAHFRNILKAITVDTDPKLTEIEMLTKEEKDQILYDFNNTYADYPRNKTLHELFEEKVENTPDNTAVVLRTRAGEMMLSYRELNEKANRLARTLREKGVKSNSIVGILVDRSLEMLVGIFGILKAGGAYLPITPEYPEDRIQYMLNDSQTNIVLTQSKHVEKVMFNEEVIDLEDNKAYSSNGENLENINTAKDLAYVIYTSGSTGKPKGVLVEHQSVVNILTNMQNDYPLMESGTYLLKTTYTFDVSVTELFGWLTGNGKIAMLPPGGEKDLNAIVEAIHKYNVTHINFVPSMLNVFLDGIEEEDFEKINSLRYIFVAGEAFSRELAKRCSAKLKNVTIENIYGPTETTIYVTRYSIADLKDEHIVPIGKPLNNVKAYVVNEDNKLLPIGVAGELCIAGECLTRGYFNRADLTAEKFDPFVQNPFSPEEKMYRTGDLVRWLPDGNIEFLGRIDHQVKIRGFRIELGEIENSLLSYEDIKEAIVIDRKDEEDNKYLCAYVVSHRELTPKELREYLSKNLPDYMIPSYFVQLERMPLNKNGKINRKALPKPEGNIFTGVEYEAPRNEIEEKLVDIWKEVLGAVLGKEKVGINDNFFELGGHSLKATVLLSKMHKKLNVEVSLSQVFINPTIKELAQYIKKAEKNIFSSIQPVAEAEYYSASSSQKRLYIMWQLAEKSLAYNMSSAVILEGEFDRARFEKTINALVNRHETLRTSFRLVNGELMQRIHHDVDLNLIYQIIEEDKLKETAIEFIRPFDLSKAPLLRVVLIKFGSNRHLLLFDMHHIISDGVSIDILTKDFNSLYDGKELSELKIQYKDYASWHNSLMDSKIMEKMSEYWTRKLDNFTYTELPVTNISFNRQSNGRIKQSELDELLTKQINEFCIRHKVSKFIFMLATFEVLIMKTINQNDISIGIPVAGRRHEDLQNIIGIFLNVLVTRTKIEKNATFTEYLYNLRDEWMETQEYQDYPYEDLYAKMKEEFNFKRDSLFSILFNYMPESKNDLSEQALTDRPYKLEEVEPKYGLTLYVSEGRDNIGLKAVFKNNLEEYIVENMLNSFETVIQTVLENEEILIKKISMAGGNNLDIYSQVFELESFVDSRSLHGKIRSIALNTPDKTAIEQGDKNLSYIGLEERANQIANFLNAKISDNKNIPVILDNSIELVEAILGIIKCGGVFAPIDPKFPENRIKLMVDEIDADWIITCNEWLDKLNRMMEGENRKLNALVLNSTANTGQLNNINLFEFNDNLQKECLVPAEISNEHCYIYFTSGSTGKPKAILGRHISLKHFIDWEIKEFGVDESFKVSQIISPSFDPFLRDIFVPLCSGATLCIPENREIILNPEGFMEWIDDKDITLIHMVPTIFKALIAEVEDPDCFKKLKYMLLAGEMLRGNDINKFFQLFGNRIELVNLYGPTETTLAKLFYRVKEEDANRVAVPVGKPIPGAQVMILNDDNQICEMGSIGEIYIRTPFISAGYYNNSDLTNKVFIINPFNDDSQDIIYKTGDLGRIHFNGDVEILGRVDHQVKLRGVRIELGEIENQLLQLENVKEAIVVAIEESLCAYAEVFTEVTDQKIEVEKLREHLRKRLPDYMIPNYFVILEKMPLTPNGKIDRKALPEPDLNNSGVQYVAPQNEIEEKLVEIWSEILDKEGIGISHNFFNLGGHSLKAASLVAKIHKELNVEVPLKEVFTNSTIKSLANYIKNAEENIYSSIQPIEENEYYPASSAQKRLYILDQMEEISTGYNIPRALMVKGALDRQKLEQSFKELINRHETLRTSFETNEGQIVQIVHKEVDLKVTSIKATKGDITEILKQFVQPFDLKKAPLLRVGLVELAEESILLFDLHHIISDGSSMGIILQEFIELYEGKELPVLPIQYKDFSAWQNKLFETGVIKKQEEYWIKRFKDEAHYNAIPVLNMPTDYPRPTMQSFEGDRINYKLDKELTKDLNRIAKETNSTMYMVLLSGINILLSKYSGQEDIIIGSPIAGRSHADLEKIIGMFVNTLAMRNQPEGNKTYEEFLLEVKENALEAYEHQEYQFEELVDKLALSKDMSRNPLFDVMFVLQNMQSQNFDNGELRIDNLELKPYNFDYKTSKFDLTISATEADDEIILNFEYSTRLYKRATVERMIAHFRNILKIVVVDTDTKLSEINMLTDEEKDWILNDFNNTDVDYPRDKTIHQLFEEQVEKGLDNIAIAFEDKQLTYRELNEKANRLARTLRENGVNADSIVGILVNHSLEMMVGILGILKAGSAYLPINSSYPEERIRYMLEDSGADILLTHEYLKNKLLFKGQIIPLEDHKIYMKEDTNLDLINNSHALAYVIYTSGSTGKPKGVLISHKALNNFVFSYYTSFGKNVGVGDNCLSLANISFDASVSELFIPLTFGASLVLFNNEMILDVHKLARTIIDESITLAYIPPTILKDLYELLSKEKEKVKLNKMMVGVEPIKDYVLEEYMILNHDMQILNGYGPTEATICATKYKYGQTASVGRNIPIGKPLANMHIYILDKYSNLVPNGVVGEIYISGDGLAKGYLNRQDLTAEKFVPNPFISGKKMYKTGDMARLLPDGNIEFIGRIDHQVKIRGYRIEPGEIEIQLLNYNSIKNAKVVDREDKNGAKYLCAYVVSDQEVTIMELREFLLTNLPEYMIPSYFVQLDKMPLTANGKINRKALPAPEGNIMVGTEYEAPRNELEEKLVEMWKDLLGIDKVGINDNFFELGGHSLKATSLVSKIYAELNVELPLREIFRKPTIRKIAEFITDSEKDHISVIDLVACDNNKEYYPVSSAQKRIFVLNQLQRNHISYNMPIMMFIEGEFDQKRFESAFERVIMRHDSFRTSFELIDGEAMQKIWQDVDFNVSYQEAKDDDIEKLIKEFIQPFDLSKVPLLRVKVVKFDQRHLMMLDMHHIISDGESMNILINDFVKLYEGHNLEELRLQYKDFTIWQNEFFKSDKIKEQETYWLKTFEDEFSILNMPTDYSRPAVMDFSGNSYQFFVDDEINTGLKELGKSHGATLYIVLLAAYNILLSRYSGQEDIIVGSPVAGRSKNGLEQIVGMFVNTLAMRNHSKANIPFEQFLDQVKENAFSAFENQNYQFEQLVEKLNVERNLSRNPLFDTMFTLQNVNYSEIIANELRLIPYNTSTQITKFDLTLSAAEMDEGTYFTLEYRTTLFKRDTITRMTKHYHNILQQIVRHPEVKLSEIKMISDEERIQLVEQFNMTKEEYPLDKTIHQLFEEQVERTPENIAVVYGDQQLTYGELNKRANQIAQVLQTKGVRVEEIVGIMVEPAVEMIVGIFGILKAGGAYLPIDPTYPVDRITYMLNDSEINVLLTQVNLKEKIQFEGQLLFLDNQHLYQKESSNLLMQSQPTDLAYVIYTSGSTGKPKGVMVEHRSLVNLVTWHNKNYGVTEVDRSTKYAGFGFDASVWEIFPYMIAGASLHIIDNEIRLDIHKLNEYFERHKITISFLPTQICEEFMTLKNKSLRKLLAGGDKLKHYLPQRYDIVNNYGPTENTVVSTSFLVDNNFDNIPIGKPISNVQILILDKHNNIQPIGVPGELSILGASLARGYLKRPELTEKSFVTNPFAVHGATMYRTGDLARWMLDGSIEFLGRIDNQVKIRGNRIELGEIESHLLNHKLVKEAIVIARVDKNNAKYLCAYIVADREVTVGELTPKELREYLLKNLPEYMIPSYFVQLDKMPLNANGKIDRKALPEPEGNIALGTEYEAPRNKTEEKLVEIWTEILGIEKVGINDNFFELGGHSLKATVLTGKILKELHVEVPLSEIFRTQTIKGISDYIQCATQIAYEAIEKADSADYYEASSAQKRMYMLQQFDLQSIGYNMPSALEVEGRLNLEKVKKSFYELIRRHETLRTSFETIEEKIVQRVNSFTQVEAEFNVELLEETDKTIEEVINEFTRTFDLSKAPLFRVSVIIVEEDKYILMFDMHHIISDGTSMGIFVNEFVSIYEGKELDELRIQYKDYAEWQNELLRSDVMKKQEEYWVNRFSDPTQNDGQVPVLNMPIDYPRPTMQSFEGDSISFKLDKELTKNLERIAKETGSTMYMVLLSGVNILLSKYSGQEDIIVGSPIAGRPHPDLDKIIGMFVNTLAMRNNPKINKTYKEFLKEVRENALKAYENQVYQFEELVDKLELQRDLSRNPLFDVMFTMQNMDSGELNIKDIKLTSYNYKKKTSKFDVTFFASEVNKEIIFGLEYNIKLFKRDTIERMISHFKKILKIVVVNTQIKLGEIAILTEEEKHLILVDFNKTEVDYPKDKTLCELFEEQVTKTPDNIAVVFEQKHLTYPELNVRSNQLARVLRQRGVKPDKVVAIMLERSLEMIVAIMGILKAGGAYLPIDPDYPLERKQYMLEDSNTEILLTQLKMVDRVSFAGDMINLDSTTCHEDGSNLEVVNKPEDLLYVIYTSGSTGKPKGVMIEHRNIINLISFEYAKTNINFKTKVLQFTTISFDVSYQEIFSTLLAGGE